MSRTYPIAGVYIITHKNTGKIYIGEATDIPTRFSKYRELELTKQRKRKHNKTYLPIEKAIIKDGIENFKFDVIVDKFDDINLENLKYRRTVEAYYIEKYNTTDPYYGYNVLKRNYRTEAKKHREGKPHTPGTKVYKSDPILVYDCNDESVMMFFGKKSFGNYLGDINHTPPVDRAIISRCARFGKKHKNYYIFPLNAENRYIAICKSIKAKLEPSAFAVKDNHKRLREFIKAAKAVNEWCGFWGYEQINPNEYMKLIPEDKFVIIFNEHTDIDIDEVGPSLILPVTQKQIIKYFKSIEDAKNR